MKLIKHLSLQQNQSPRETNQNRFESFNAYSTTNSQSLDETSRHENQPLLSSINQNTPLVQRSITSQFGIFPLEIWQQLFNFCSTPTLTILCSVSKNISAAINEIEGFEPARLYTQDLIASHTISPLKQSICRYTLLLNQENFEAIDHLKHITHLPLNELKEFLPTRDPNNTKTQPIARLVNGKVKSLFRGLVCCVISISLLIASWVTLINFMLRNNIKKDHFIMALVFAAMATTAFLMIVLLCCRLPYCNNHLNFDD